LLKAGANPNEYRRDFSEEPAPSSPLFNAIRNKHEDMVKLLIEFGAGELPSLVREVRWNANSGMGEVVEIVCLPIAEENGMLELLSDRPATPAVANASYYINKLRLEITKPLRSAISEFLVVAFMRGTGQPPPMGVISYSILSFCKFLDYDSTASPSYLRQTS
jgi:hypothetical protein